MKRKGNNPESFCSSLLAPLTVGWRRWVGAAALLLAGAVVVNAATPVEKLRARLAKIQKKGIMIGHQDDPFYGTTWHFDKDRSDVKEVCGDYPAVMGFELGQLELDSARNLDGVPFDRMRQEIVAHYQRGGVVTISWHPWNPVTGKNAWDPTGQPVSQILPGGAQNFKFEQWLCKVAVFLKSLKTRKGQAVPVIFRPWHEMHGGWFWWGKNSCTPEEFQRLFQYTIQKLRQQGVFNCLYCYSPGGSPDETAESYMKFYPGDDYVDMFGVDIYGGPDKAKYIREVRQEFAVINALAREHRKLVCFAETGYRNTPDPDWFTTGLWEAVKDLKITYVLLWRNAWDQPQENFGPAPEKSCAEDFRRLHADKRTLFLKDIQKF